MIRLKSLAVVLLLLPKPGASPAKQSALPAFAASFRWKGLACKGNRSPKPKSSDLSHPTSLRRVVSPRHFGPCGWPLRLSMDVDTTSLPYRPRAERVATAEETRLNNIRTARGRAEKQSGKYHCVLCNCAFAKLKNFDQHLAGKQHQANTAAVEDVWERFKACAKLWLSEDAGSATGVEEPDGQGGRTYSVGNQTLAQMDVVKAWNPGELQGFPMRASGEGCLSPATRFQDLSLYMQARLLKYVSELMPYYPELPSIVVHMAAGHPQHLRVKELFESFETFKLLENFIVAAKKHRQIDHIYDVACGHGLVGMLLAYRFPATAVVGVDVAVRPAMEAWKQAFSTHGRSQCCDNDGQEMKEWTRPLQNFDFVNCGVEDLKGSAGARLEASLLVAVHGCNEVNQIAIETAISADGLWATLPCCVPEQLYMPGASIKLSDDLNDDVRHNFMCGVMAERYKAQFIAQIDRRITNRATMIAGGVSQLDGRHPAGTKLVGFSRRVFKVSTAFAAKTGGME